MADVKWIKIATDIFDDEKILLIESLPEADLIIVIWFKLLCLAGKQNNSGVFIMNNSIPYTDKMLATIFRRKESTVQLALKTFEQFGMVQILDGVITIPNWEKHQQLDTLETAKEKTRQRVAKHREKQKRIASAADDNAESNVTCNVTQPVTVTHCNADRLDKIREDKIRLDNIMSDSDESDTPPQKKAVRHKYGEYQNVLLSDDQLEKLKTEFPYDWEARIENLSEYMASTGKSYKNHLATIRNWARKDVNRQHGKASYQQPKPQQSGNVFLDMLHDTEE